MKRLLSIITIAVLFTACGPSEGEGGVRNDGIDPVDSNGAFNESTPYGQDEQKPTIDSTIGEDRVDVQQRGVQQPPKTDSGSTHLQK